MVSILISYHRGVNDKIYCKHEANLNATTVACGVSPTLVAKKMSDHFFCCGEIPHCPTILKSTRLGHDLGWIDCVRNFTQSLRRHPAGNRILYIGS